MKVVMTGGKRFAGGEVLRQLLADPAFELVTVPGAQAGGVCSPQAQRSRGGELITGPWAMHSSFGEPPRGARDRTGSPRQRFL